MSGFNASDWALRHRALVWYFMLVLLVAGVSSYYALGRDEDPAFTIRTMVVQARWPGATVEETLKELTDRIEKKLQELPRLEYTKSYTKPGEATVYVNLEGATPAREVADLWYQVRKKIGDIKPTLPEGVQGPFFNDEFGDTYAVIYAFTADGFTHRQLRDWVEAARSRLLEVKDVGKIDLVGTQDERIYIEFSARQLATLGVNRQQLLAALHSQNAVVPAGILQTPTERIVLQVSGAFRSEADIEAVNFYANNRFFTLRDIAKVTRGPADPPQPLFRFNGKPAIALAISMVKGGDVLALGRNLEAKMAETRSDLPVGIEPHLVANQPHVVEQAVGTFTKSLWEAIAIVLLVSFLSLGFRAGLVVACSIPLVLAAVFVVMEIAGISLQRISLGALVIALGLLVDDAMITVEMMVAKLEEGLDKVKAATFAYTSTAFPMLTGTLVTVVGFVPVGFAKSAAGEYVFSLFFVIAVALVVSWVVAVVFAPLLGVAILPDRLAQHGQRSGVIGHVFRRALDACLRRRWATVLATLALFLLALGAMNLVPQQFFPASDRAELLVDLKLPQNAAITATNAEAKKLEALLAADRDVERFSLYVGRGAVRFYLPLNVQLANDFFAQAVVVTRGLAERDRVRARLEAALETQFPNVVGRVSPLELGPPIGWPLQFRVRGPDLQEVRRLAYEVAALLGKDPAARQVNFDWIEPARIMRIEVSQDRARQLGVSSEALAQALNTVVAGQTTTQVRDDIYLVDVVARSVASERASLDVLRALQVPLTSGRTVPLGGIATFTYALEQPLVWRRDRQPTLTVQADVTPGVQPATVVARLASGLAELRARLPDGYRIDAAGTVEESAKGQASVNAAVPLMLLLMVTILMVQLQSFRQLVLVMSVAPLGIIGVAAALLLSSQPMGFVAILGIIALVGMIVRNSVILIDQIETNVAAGQARWDAVVHATEHRMRPILLTAAAAILGMLPIAFDVFWGPMAYAVMGGLAGATLLTLLFLPALYVAWYRVPAPARAAPP